MSRKDFDKLDRSDQLIRRIKPPGMDDGVHVTIQYFTGFEIFNTAPYHNHETWCGGYSVEGLGVYAEAEDLDDAVQLWAKKVEEQK
jgi:hypothetical protein